MTRDSLRAAIIGFVFGLTLCIGLLALHDGQVSAAIRAQDAHSDSLTKALLVSERERRAAQEGQERANAQADRKSAAAEAVANRLGTLIRDVPVPGITPSGPAALTVRMVPLDAFLKMKYAWESERAARVHADSVTIPALERRVAVADSVIASQQKAIALRDARSNPRCGRKCGIVIGVGSTIVGIVVLEKAVRIAR